MIQKSLIPILLLGPVLSITVPSARTRSFECKFIRKTRLHGSRYEDLAFDDVIDDIMLTQSTGVASWSSLALPVVLAAGTALIVSGRNNPLGINTGGEPGILSAENSASSPPPPVDSLLVETCWELLLDFGREKFTYMPPTWAASGLRIELPLLIRFEANGTVTPLASGAFLDFPLAPGRWRVTGSFPNERLNFWLDTGGYSRGDNELPAGPLYFSTAVFGPQISNKQGIMSIDAVRFFVRRERRMVGTFRVIAKVPQNDKLPFLRTVKVYTDKTNVR